MRTWAWLVLAGAVGCVVAAILAVAPLRVAGEYECGSLLAPTPASEQRDPIFFDGTYAAGCEIQYSQRGLLVALIGFPSLVVGGAGVFARAHDSSSG